jgi:hypothetical protein
VAFIQKCEEQTGTIQLDDKDCSSPPPYQIFSNFIQKLLCICRHAAANGQQSCFSFVYTEKGKEKRIDWFIDYNKGKNPLVELTDLIRRTFGI